jgi:hypothetical protein
MLSFTTYYHSPSHEQQESIRPIYRTQFSTFILGVGGNRANLLCKVISGLLLGLDSVEQLNH